MKNIIVTGASGNLGKVTVERLVKAGYHVVAAISAGKSLCYRPADVTEYEVDLADESASDSFVASVIQQHKTIDAVILLVGVYGAGNIATTDGSSLQKMLSLNFNTAYYTARAAFNHMSKQEHGGRIIFIGSRPAINAVEGKEALGYGLSKSLLFKFAEFLNAEGADKDIVSSVIVPGLIDTPPNRAAVKDPNAKWVKAEEIADFMAYLISDDAKSLSEPVIKLYGN